MKPWMMKAEHALATGQPRLAELYMRRGLMEDPAGRQWLAWHDVVQTVVDTWQQLADAFLPLVEFVTAAAATNQDDVALVGPAKGGAQ